jgi:hypothetical protein
MNTIKHYFKLYTERMKEKRHQRLVRRSEELFQIREYKGKVWFTYNGELICPTSILFNSATMTSLQQIRELYVQRNLEPYGTESN